MKRLFISLVLIIPLLVACNTGFNYANEKIRCTAYFDSIIQSKSFTNEDVDLFLGIPSGITREKLNKYLIELVDKGTLSYTFNSGRLEYSYIFKKNYTKLETFLNFDFFNDTLYKIRLVNTKTLKDSESMNFLGDLLDAIDLLEIRYMDFESCTGYFHQCIINNLVIRADFINRKNYNKRGYEDCECCISFTNYHYNEVINNADAIFIDGSYYSKEYYKKYKMDL